jgi:predicted nucleic acid-binding protein
MKELFILDACGLIAFLGDEPGSRVIETLLRRALIKDCEIYMNIINLLEVYYGIYREDGKDKADEIYNKVVNLPITIIDRLTEEHIKESGRLKASYKISLADSIVLAYGRLNNAKIITSDHHEFDIIDKNKEVSFYWFR